jgi:glycosyltransferase involved in cell wall biosynthesis/2-polyprenyl-3-methyl-5-hydroxy-6-metoxy-1,4-benzoquinol methylase
MKDKNILLIGSIPPPINGQTLSFQALVEEMNVESLMLLGLRGVNMRVFLSKIFVFLGLLIRLFGKVIFKNYVVYQTFSQSKEGFFRDFPIVFISKFLGSKVIGHIHGGNYDGFYFAQNRLIKSLIRNMLKQTDSIIILSENMKSMFDFEPTVLPKIKIIKNGLSWKMDTNDLKIKELPINSQKPIKIIFLSNLIESKGYWDVLEATNILVNQYGYNVQTDFCGEFIQYPDAQRFTNIDEAKEHFFGFIKANKLQHHVNYRGIIEGEPKKQLLEEAHFFILPTSYINEGQPISIIEAWAYRCVVLTTNYRGISEMLIPNESAIYVEYNRPETIVETVKNLLHNPTEYQRISENGYQNFLNNYTKEKHLKALMKEINSHLKPQTAIDFHSAIALDFKSNFQKSEQFTQRFQVWTSLFEKYIKPKMSVLDAGCGAGVFSHYLAKKGCEVVGIDGAENMIRLCNKVEESNNLDLVFYQEILPFKNVEKYGSKDVIICSSVLEYIDNYEKIIAQFAQILNNQGFLIVSMPNRESWYRQIEKYIFRFTGKPNYYKYSKHLINENEFSDALKKHGFERKEVVFYPHLNQVSRLLNCLGFSEKKLMPLFVGVYRLAK